MSDQQSFNKEEIAKIFSEASRIQVQKDLGLDQEGLNIDELIQVAKELGIEPDSLLKAIANKDYELDEDFNWLKGTTRIQLIKQVEGEFHPDQWEDIVREIRRVTGGIGKISKVGKSYEWEQRRRDIGYKHFSFTPEKGKTQIQMVSSWGGLRMLSQVVGFMLPFSLTAIALEGTEFFDIPKLVIAVGAGLFIGLPLTRVYLKSVFSRQKKLLQNLVAAVSLKLRKLPAEGEIRIEDKEVYNNTEKGNADSDQTPVS